MRTIASSTLALQARPADRQAVRAQAYGELQEMSKAMIEEKGLLNFPQAALLLDVSTKRVWELVRLKKLRRFDFLGRTYVSMQEVGNRYQKELKAGRPARGIAKRAVASVRAALKTDSTQAKFGGYAGPYIRDQERKKGEKHREEFRRVWRTITGGPKK
jgi:hypothetical protein